MTLQIKIEEPSLPRFLIFFSIPLTQLGEMKLLFINELMGCFPYFYSFHLIADAHIFRYAILGYPLRLAYFRVAFIVFLTLTLKITFT